jgi:hypothetical protein
MDLAMTGCTLTEGWKCSTEGNVWADRIDVPLGETIPFSDAAAQQGLVNSKSKFQQIDGWADVSMNVAGKRWKFSRPPRGMRS